MWRGCVLGFALGLWVAVAPSCSGAKCGPSSCSSGCCDSSGNCQAGTTGNACGSAGGACMACSSGQTCQAGTCNSCSGASCNGSDGGGGNDSGTVDAGFSACGHPGDQGNSLGVGKYCTRIQDCPTTAPICSNINNDPNNPQLNTFFCVLPNCDPCGPASACGGNASCVCLFPGECGCTPNSCSAIFPDGGGASCDGGTTDGGPGSDAGTGDGGSDGGTCIPSPAGTCIPDSCATGNEKHIGAYCSKGGKQCNQYGNLLLQCAIDLSTSGDNFCILLLCTQNSDCGTESCCTGDPTQPTQPKACVPYGCIVTDGGACPPPA
jgi:hypothetical protein